MACPIDYSLCTQTVTVYHYENGTLWRQVLEGCYYAHEQVALNDALGKRLETRFLLIVPGACQNVWVGDRICEGVGPEIDDIDWQHFIPALVPGLSQVAYTKGFWWGGEICHMEAGWK